MALAANMQIIPTGHQQAMRRSPIGRCANAPKTVVLLTTLLLRGAAFRWCGAPSCTWGALEDQPAR
jgi:hypothetical protein